MLGALAGDTIGSALARTPRSARIIPPASKAGSKSSGGITGRPSPPPQVECAVDFLHGLQPVATQVVAPQGCGPFHGLSLRRRGQHLFVRLGMRAVLWSSLVPADLSVKTDGIGWIIG